MDFQQIRDFVNPAVAQATGLQEVDNLQMPVPVAYVPVQLVIDGALSLTSENPVQNKVIAVAIQHHGVVYESGSLKDQPVDTGGGYFMAGMAAGHYAGHHIDPLHETAAEKALEAVDMGRHQNLHLLGAGLGNGFALHGQLPFFIGDGRGSKAPACGQGHEA